MNRLITTGDVCEYLKIADTATLEPHIDTAHALVAAAIQTTSLDRREVTERHRLRNDCEILQLRDGPITDVISVEVNGEAMDLEDLVTRAWSIENPDGWLTDDVIEVEYVVGFIDDSATDVPDNIRQALIAAAAQAYQTPNTDLVYEKIGDYTRQTMSGVPGRQSTSALDPRTLLFLREYKKPQFA